MRRNLILLDLLLAALIGVVCWLFWNGYQETLRRQKAFLGAPAPVPPAPLVALPPPQPRISAANYIDIAARLLFSKDRNPTVVLDEAPPKPMPPLPRYYGMMNFGGGPRVVLADKPGGMQKSYVAGESIGEFKLVAITGPGLIFERDGKRIPARYEEMRDAAPPSDAAPGAGAAAAAAPAETGVQKIAPAVAEVAGAKPGGPGTDVGASMKACQNGDTSPNGTVSDGYRKVVTETPFGKSCRWDKVN